jgi:AcrR family transcriptional regulator
MGNREALLLGAKQCLLKKGYTRTTARDIASAAGVSLAAIGYHFSSKEALLTEALILAIDDWGMDFRHALMTVPDHADPAQRFEATWARLIETFHTHRPLWAANFELFAQMDHLPEIRRILGDSLLQARLGLASLFLNRDVSEIDEHTARTTGAFYHALMSGLIAQWLINPKHALSARDLTEALRAVTATLQPTRKTSKTKSNPAKKRSTKR